MKKHTVLDYLNALPDGIREKALANHTQDSAYRISSKSKPTSGYIVVSMAEALLHAFNWGCSLEGHEYWLEISLCHINP